MKGESQKSKLSTRAVSSNSIRATSAGAVSVTAQPPTSSVEDLKHGVEDNQSVKSESLSAKNGENTPINNENENKTSREDIHEEGDAEGNDNATNNGEEEQKMGKIARMCNNAIDMSKNQEIYIYNTSMIFPYL